MSPSAYQARGKVLQLSKLNLHFPFVTLCTLCKNIEYQAGAVDHPDFQFALEVTLLRRRQRMIENNDLDLIIGYRMADFLGFAGADEQRRIGAGALGQ